jgi:hypothetical protein
MPLCPQITNTPVTVSQTGDFTVTSVVPAVPDTQDGLADTIDQIVLNSGAVVYYQNDAPTDPPNDLKEGDIWFDTNDGNKQYYYSGSAWISVQDTAIAAAQSAATAAQTTADGKNKVYRQTTMPTAGPFAEGDLWFDTDDDNKFYRYTGGAFSSFTLGDNALASLSANKITAGTIDASVITVSNLNAGNISTGTLNADRIAAASITGSKIVAGTITASNIATNTITATQIAAGTITATQIASNTITASQIAAGTITATQIAAGTITTDKLVAGTLTGYTIQTSSSGDAVVMSGSSNSLFFKYSGTVYGHMMANTSGNVMIHYGATATPAGTAYPQLFVGSTAVVLSQSVTRFATIDSNGLGVNGDLSVASGAFYTGTYETTSTAQTVGAYIPQSGSVIARRDNQIPIFAHRFNASGTAELIRLVYNGSDAGGIQTSSAGSPSFRSTSDYRLKNNIQDYTAGTNIIKNLRVRSYEMNNNPGKTEIGFIAHEYAETVPDMVNGVKDAIDADGNPEYQSISTTNLIPYLVGALKDAILRIESLEQGE